MEIAMPREEEKITIDSRSILRQLRRMNGRLTRVDSISGEKRALNAYDMELELQEAHDGFHCAQAFGGKLPADGSEAFSDDEFEFESAIAEQAKQSIQKSIATLKTFGLLEHYQLYAVNIEQIQLDIQWTIDALKIVEEQWENEHVDEAEKEIRDHKRKLKKKIDKLLKLINFIGKQIGLKKAILIFDEKKMESRHDREWEKMKRADICGREYKSKFEKLVEQPTGFLESIFG